MGTRPVKSSGPLRPVGLETERATSEKPNRLANSDGPGTNHRSGPIDYESSIETYASIDERGGFWAKRKLRESAHPAREGADRRILAHRKEAERFLVEPESAPLTDNRITLATAPHAQANIKKDETIETEEHAASRRLLVRRADEERLLAPGKEVLDRKVLEAADRVLGGSL